MAVRDSVVFDEYQMAKSLLAAIPQIEQAYAESSPNGLSVLIVVPDKNEDVQNKIFEAEAELIDAFPSLAVDFDVVFRCNRDPKDIISPRGVRLVTRETHER